MSTVNSQKRQAKRSVKDVNFRSKNFKHEPKETTTPERKEKEKDSLSAADRLKASMANFAKSKLSEKDKNTSSHSKFGSRKSMHPQTPDRDK